MIIDFHTHRQPLDKTIAAVVNLVLPVRSSIPASHNLSFSAGIHPWQLVDIAESQIVVLSEQLEEAVVTGALDVIGECGLDRTLAIALDAQTAVFEQQIGLAEKYQLPLIIHCVRAYPELIAICKTHLPTVPWLIHGYNGNRQQLEQLMKYDKCYFSFGPALLQHAEKFRSLLSMVPRVRLLLETDDADINIMDIYQQAANLIACRHHELCEQMDRNWHRLIKPLELRCPSLEI